LLWSARHGLARPTGTGPHQPSPGDRRGKRLTNPGRGARPRFRTGSHHDSGNNEASQRRRRAARGRDNGYGLVLFASVLLVIVSCFNLIYGIAAVTDAHLFTANAHYVFGSLNSWGWITLIIDALQLLAAAGVLAGNQLARWFGVAVLGLSAIEQMFFIPAYSFWSLMILAVDVVALYELCACGSRANLDAACLARRALASHNRGRPLGQPPSAPVSDAH
jgi:hypothetical protein